MASETLFSILSRQPWWISAVVAAVLFGITELVYPPVAFFVALPFLLLAAFIAYKQLRGTGQVSVPEKLAALRDMSWENFSLVVSEAYRRQGYTVAEAHDSAYDFELTKNGRRTLVSCRRWKVNSVGTAPLQALAGAVSRLDAYNAICIAAGDFSQNARDYAATQPITLVTGIELVKLVGRVSSKRNPLF
ncbi:MAG: restriction endonuclease [Rhodospirillaceae bacterium]